MLHFPSLGWREIDFSIGNESIPAGRELHISLELSAFPVSIRGGKGVPTGAHLHWWWSRAKKSAKDQDKDNADFFVFMFLK